MCSHSAVSVLLCDALAGDAPGRKFSAWLFVWSKSHGCFIALLCPGQCESGGGLECTGTAGFAIAGKEERWLSTFFKTAWGTEPRERQEGLT